MIFIIIISVIVILFLSLSTSQNMTVVYKNNLDKKVIPIIVGKFQDSDCGMVIDNLTYSSEVISPTGNTWFFHDHGGMVNWIKDKSFKDEAVIWVMAKDTKHYIKAQNAWYSRTDKTPMLYGFGAYENKKKNFIDFKTMFLYMVRGEHLKNGYIRKRLLGE